MSLPDKQQEAISAYAKHKTEADAARELGIDVKALRGRLWSAVKNGWRVEPAKFCEQAPVGFGLNAQSILTNADGETLLTWSKVSPIFSEETQEYFNQRIPAAPVQLNHPVAVNSDLMLEWCLFDHHQGLLSWAKETGADYDNKIAKMLMINAAKKIFSMYGPVEHTVILGGGDNLHMDSRSNQTEKSHHVLDVDSRYHRTSWIAYETWCVAIDTALQQSKTVEIIVVSGNHDFHHAIHLSMVLAAHYRNEPRVIVNTSPAKHKFYRFGSNFFMVTHGDTGAKRLPAYLLNYIIQHNLTGIERMFVRAGHLHKKSRVNYVGLDEDSGVRVELFPTLAASDAWASEEAYTQIRATVANLWHREYGKRGELELCVKELMEVA